MKIMRLKNNRSLNIWLPVCGILVPLVIIALYLFLVAQDRYVSESVVVVKQVGEVSTPTAGGLGALLGTDNTSVEDSRYLKEYVESYDMLKHLDQSLHFRQAFQGNGYDKIFQLRDDASREQLLKYYNSRLTVELDETTSLLTIRTEGFTPEFALKFNNAVLQESDRFVNAISQQVAREQLKYSEDQYKDATARLTKAREEVLNYQNNNQMLDPQSNAEAVSKVMNSLRASLSDLQTQERTLLSYLNPDTPQVIALRSQIQAVQQQISNEQSKLTASGDNDSGKLNRKALQFEALKAEVEFNTDLYKVSLSSLEKSKLDAVRKLKSLIKISSPQLAEDSLYPRRLYILLSFFLILTLIYGFIRLAISIVRDHQD